jgi:peptidyl-prolyl cis-trans isomerase C
MSNEEQEQSTEVEETPQPIMVNGEPVTEQVINQEISVLRERYSRNMLPEEFAQKEAQIEDDARENAVERMLLIQAAIKQFPRASKSEVTSRLNKMKREAGGPQAFYQRYGLTSADDERIRKDIAIDIRYDQFLDEITRDVPAPAEEECREFYDKNEKVFTEPERVQASHILLRQGSGMDTASVYTRLLNLKKQLEAGADFNAIAEQLSSEPGESGDLGWFVRGQMVMPFEEAAFSMQPGEISDIVQTDFGYHLIKLFDRKPEQLRPFKEAQKEISEHLWHDKKNNRIGETVDQLKNEAKIIYPDQAPAETDQ